MPTPDISLLNVATFFEGQDHQIAALKYLQSELPKDTLDRLAYLYRSPTPSGEECNDANPIPGSGQPLPEISLINVCKYFDNLPHQEDALLYLQEVTPPDVLLKFQDLYRSGFKSKSDPKPATPYNGVQITLPDGIKVFTDQPIMPGGSFSWGEATHGGTRIPTKEAAANIKALAAQLQSARNRLGKPMRITSWYRPEPFNSRVGGAKYSQHLTGKAADIVVAGYSGRQLAVLFESWWPGGLGVYPGYRKHILHLDIGPKRHWGF